MKAHLLAAAAAVALALFSAVSPLAAQPVITEVQNNYSYILPGLPNYGIAPGSLFLIVGTGMANPGSSATPLQDPSQALPQTLNGASVSFSVNGVTTHPALYYATPNYIAGVLPSSMPLGTLVQVTVTYGNATSLPYNTTVAQSAFGFDTYYETGSGMAAVRDNNSGYLIDPTCDADSDAIRQCIRSAYYGETVVFWGSGVGADTKNDDRDPPTNLDNLSGIAQLFIGGVTVPIVYQGRSHYQGVDQVDVTLPSNVPTGCAVSVVAVSGSGGTAVVSNTVTIPITASGGACTDALQPIPSTLIATLSGHPLVNFGSLSLTQATNTTGVNRTASAQFASILGKSLFPYLSNTLPSLGSCIVYQQAGVAPTNPFQLEGLLPGTIDVSGSNGVQALSTLPSGPGLYTASVTAGFLPPAAGSFTFIGQGGTDVQPFTAALNFPNPMVWTNQLELGNITRAQGVAIDWTGADPDTYVQISGSATSNQSTVFFVCDAPVGPGGSGTFTVPPAVLMALPPAGGGIMVANNTYAASFTASALDFGFASSSGFVFGPATYQ